jgi:prevent-host-death family protein
MIHVEDIYSLTDFQRHAKEHIERLKETGRPEVLTVNGKAEVVVQDAAAYQRLLDLVDRLQAIEGIQKGVESM